MPAPSAANLIRHLTPPDDRASLLLARRAEARTARRLARLERRLGRAALPSSERDPLRRLVAECRRRVTRIPGPLRRRLLHGPDLRGLLAEAEMGLDLLERAQPGRDPARLFDLVARTEHLTTLVPRGRLDRGFPARARRLAAGRLRRLAGEMSALLLGLRLADPRPAGGLRRFRLEARADPEQGRPADRIDLGTFGGTAGPLTIHLGARGAALVRAVLTPASLRLRQSPWPETVLPLGALDLGGPLPAGPSPRPARRGLIPGTPIVLTPAVRSSGTALGTALVVGREMPGLQGRLARGLRLVALAWPEGAREIVRRTALVVPVLERRLVSYSLAARPGVSFINVAGKRTVDLADDLLHETAHHLLHELQEEIDLLVRGPETEETQAFDSPWRRARRPLHGILHGAFTFLFRAELFTRILEARRRIPGVIDPLLGRGGARFVARERRRELGMMARALRDLGTARRAGLLTPAGRSLVAGLAAWHRRLLSGGSR